MIWLVTVEEDDSDLPEDDENTTSSARASRVTRGCGLSTRDQSRVTGGRPTSSKEWPWVAAILINGEQVCGGVLITDRHILTAAHCVHRSVSICANLKSYENYPW